MGMLQEGIIIVQLEHIRVRTHSDFAAMALPLGQGSGLLHWSCAAGNTNRRYEQMKVKRGRGLAGLALQIGRLLTWDAASGDAAKLHGMYRDCPVLMAEGLQAAAAVPLHSFLLPDAGLLLVGRRQPNAYSAAELLDVQTCAEALGDLL